MLISDILDHNARIYPGKEAIVCGDESLTFRELELKTLQLSGLFLKMGLRKGDHIAVLAHNSPEYVALLFSLIEIGAVVSPLNFLLIPGELIRILNDLGARVLLFAGDHRDSVEKIRDACPLLERCICIDGEIRGYNSLPALLDEKGGGTFKRENLDEDDVAMIVYGGTMGKRPIGTMLTHKNIMCASYFSALDTCISRDDVYLSTAPLPFLAGTGRMLKFMLVGAKVVIMKDFEPELTLRLIEEHGVTRLLLVPQMMTHMVSEAKRGKYNLSSLKKITYSSVIPVEISALEEALSFFRCDFIQSFAQVESSGVISYLHVSDEVKKGRVSGHRRLSSIGKEMIGISVTVVDPEGAEGLPNRIGELVVGGPTVMKGYHNNPFLSEETVRDGRLRSGFAASIDDDGYIYVVGRLRDSIVRGGINIDPAEIEEILSEHEEILEVAVVGKPDFEWGEVPVAIVVVKADFAGDKDQIMDYANSHLARFKVPVFIEFARTLPRNSQGKILKAQIKEEIKREII